MPCKDSSSQMTLTLDGEERLVDYAFGKITCGKIIGGEARYLAMCRGKGVEEILRIGFTEAADRLEIAEGEEQFFLFLEWDAVRSGLNHYMGRVEVDPAPERNESQSVGESDHVGGAILTEAVGHARCGVSPSAASGGDGVSQRAGLHTERCQVASVDYDEDRVVIRLIIKPPKEMPKILPCSIADRKG